jgi:oxygen-independent coproporphyrinogen III oxidase
MAGLYIHIPFCKQACSYCDFYFLTRRQLKDPFVDALVAEIREYRDSAYSGEPVKTIYFGGGTPSQLSVTQLERIFDALRDTFNIDAGEITMELNPDDVTGQYLEQIRGLGVNRASVGVQSFHEELLRFMHRAHTREEAFRALELLKEAGFETFTADLIYGNPGQTVEMLRKDIDELLAFSPPHISAYSLTVEPGTRLGKQVKMGRIEPSGDEETGKQFDLLTLLLKDAGLFRYEVSNYSVPGFQALHNSSYWSHENYLGLGPSAHSFWWDEGGARRWRIKPDLKHYLSSDPSSYREDEELLDLKTLAEERLMLGLRTSKGVTLEELQNRYDYRLNDEQLEWLAGQVDEGTFWAPEKSLRLEDEGLRIADHLIVELLRRG